MMLPTRSRLANQWMERFNHPYTRLLLEYFLAKSLLMGSLWLLVMGLYHLIYFVLNLSEISTIAVELVFLWGYGGVGLLTAGVLFVLLRRRKPFAEYLETTFDLSFRWYNELDKSKQKYWKVPIPTARTIFKEVSIWKDFWHQTTYFWGAGYGFLILLIGFHLGFPKLTATFEANAQAVFLAHTYTYKLTYEPRVNQGDNWSIQYQGDYDTASFYLAEKHVLTLKDEDVDHLTNVKNSFKLAGVLRKGRIRKLVELEITVTLPPVLEAVSVQITHIPTRKRVETWGVKRILIDQPSRITAALEYRAGDVLDQANISVQGVLTNEDEQLTSQGRVLSYSLSDPASSDRISRITFSTVIRASSQITIVATNIYGQTSAVHEIVFVVRENLPPTLTIESPPALLSLFELQDVPVVLTAQDDVALKSLTLYVAARTREDKLLWETNLTYPPEKIRGRISVEAQMSLPLLAKRSPTGTRFIYWAEVADYADLTTRSSQQIVYYRPKSDFFKESETQSEAIEDSLNVQNESIGNLSKEYERLEILSEKKLLEQKDIERFQENAATLNERLREDQDKISALEQTLESRNSLSPALRKKLEKLKETLSEIDQDFLRQITEDGQKILENFANNVSAEQLREEVKRLDINRLEQRIEQTLQLLANLKTLQELNNLKELAENLYERFRDLEGYMVFSDLTDEEILSETQELQNELRYIAKQFNELEADLPSNPQFDKWKQGVKRDLQAKAIDEFAKTAQNRTNQKFIRDRAAQLDRIRKNLTALTQSSSAEELTEALAELNYQISTLGEKNLELTQLLAGERYPRRILREAFLREVLSKFSSSEKAMLKNFKDNLENVGGGGRWDLSVFERYEGYVKKLETLQRAIDPAAQLRQTQQVKAQNEIINLITLNNDLASLLMVLKKQLLSEREAEQLQNALANAADNQTGLNRRLDSWLNQRGQQLPSGSLSAEEEAYLQSLLAEQAYIRELLEQLAGGQGGAGQSNQQGQEGQQGQGSAGQNGEGQNGEGQNGEGQNGEGNGQTGTGQGQEGQGGTSTNSGELGDNGTGLPNSNSLRQLTERMRQLEEELIRRNPDLKRIRELKSLIENNLLRHSAGLKKEQEQDERDEKREAERDFEPYQTREIGKVGNDNLYLIQEKLSELQTKNVYPKEYRTKIEVFFKALRQSLQNLNPASP